jgi:hypothetical protein
MFTAFVLVRDYIEVNLRRTKNDALVMCACIIVIQLAMRLRYGRLDQWPQEIAALLIACISWAFALVAIFCGLFLVSAYCRLVSLARQQGMPMSAYIQSSDYLVNGKPKLTRQDRERKWW